MSRHPDSSLRAINHVSARIRAKLPSGYSVDGDVTTQGACQAALEDFHCLPKPRGGDWLAENPKELTGQSFGAFVQRAIGMNAIPSRARNTIYIQPFAAASVVLPEVERSRRDKLSPLEACPRHPPHIQRSLPAQEYHDPKGQFMMLLTQFLRAYFGENMNIAMLPLKDMKQVTGRVNTWEGCCKAKTCASKGAKQRFAKLYGSELKNGWSG